MHTQRKLAGDCRRACRKIWDFRRVACVADAGRTLWRRCKKGWKQWDELDENSEGISAVVIDMACQLQGPLWPLIHLHGRCRDWTRQARGSNCLHTPESALFWIALDWSMACVPRIPGDNLTACRIRSATIVFCWKPGEPFSATIESE